MNRSSLLWQWLTVTFVILVGCCSCRGDYRSRASTTVHVDAALSQAADQTLGMEPWSGVAVSPDGRWLAVLAHTMPIYRTDTLERVYTLKDQDYTNRYTSADFAPNGKLLAAGHADGRVTLWDLATGEQVTVLDGHSGRIRDVRFVLDGTALAAIALYPSVVLLWDVATGEEVLASQEPPEEEWSTMAVSPDGSLLAIGTRLGTLLLNELATGERARTLEQDGASVTTLEFSPDGTTLAVGHWGDSASLWDVATGKRLDHVHTRGRIDRLLVNCLAFSPDGTMLAVGTVVGEAFGASAGAVSVWDLTTSSHLFTHDVHSALSGLAFSPDGAMLWSTLTDGSLFEWDVATGERVRLVGPTSSVAFMPDGATLASAGPRGAIILWDLATGGIRKAHADPSLTVFSTAFSRDGSRLAFGTEDGAVLVWDLAVSELANTLEGPAGSVYGLAFSSDGSTLALVYYHKGKTSLWSVTAGQPLRSLAEHTGAVVCEGLSPDGTTLVTGFYTYTGQEPTVIVWDMRTGQRLATLHSPPRYLHRCLVAFSPDGSTLAFGTDRSRQVTFWNPATGRCRKSLHFESDVHSLAYSPDGRMLAVGGYGEIAVVDTETNELLYRLQGHSQIGHSSVAFSSDSATVAAGTTDGRVSLWHLGGEATK